MNCWVLGRLLLMTDSADWVRLSDWGRGFGRSPRVSWQMLKDGRLPEDLEVRKVGRIFYVRSKAGVAAASAPRTVLYARVSSSDQAADLVRQAERLQEFGRKHGWVVDETVMETASGLNPKRVKLLRVLGQQGPLRLVVEHRGRLARFGFEMVDASLRGRGGEVVVVDDGEPAVDDLVRDVTDVLTVLCARLHGERSAKRRAERVVSAVVDGAAVGAGAAERVAAAGGAGGAEGD